MLLAVNFIASFPLGIPVDQTPVPTIAEYVQANHPVTPHAAVSAVLNSMAMGNSLV